VKKGERRKNNKRRRNQLAPLTRKRAGKRKRRKNPAFNIAPADLRTTICNVRDASLFSFAAAALNLLTAYGGIGKLEPFKTDCVCGGTCLCHTGLQLAGVPCPADCPNADKHFDGCHRCDCVSPITK
jgi:hypothetical protein